MLDKWSRFRRALSKVKDIISHDGEQVKSPVPLRRKRSITKRFSVLLPQSAGSQELLISNDGERKHSNSDTKEVDKHNKTTSRAVTRTQSLNYGRNKSLKKHSATKVPKRMPSFVRSHKKSNSDGKIELPKKSSVDETSQTNACLLRYAVRTFNTARVLELVSDEETNVDEPNRKGITALHEASIDGNIICLKMLVIHGALINVIDKEGFTPLDYAVFAGSFECAAFLIENGAKEDNIRDGQIARKDDYK